MKKVELTSPSASEQAIRDGRIEEVIVVDNGRPVALVVPFDEDDMEWYAREHDPEFIQSIARAREQVKAKQTVSENELKSRLGLA